MSWPVKSDDSELRVSFVNGKLSVYALDDTGGPNWGYDLPEALVDHVWQNGAQIPVTWKFRKVTETDETVVVDLQNANPPIELRSIWRGRKGPGPIEHWTEFINHSKTKITIPEQESLSLDGLTLDGNAEAWWVRRGASNALTEGGVFQNPVEKGMNLNLVSNHHQPNSPVPWLSVQVGKNHGLYVGWEFSSTGRVQATASDSKKLSIRVGLMPDFKTDVEPGETFIVPTAFVGCYQGDIDAGSRRLHQFTQQKLLPKSPDAFQKYGLILNEYLDAGADHANEADVLRCIQFAKVLGLEVFMPDAMWFPACGDWRWDPARFPNGVKPIEKAIHGSGMKLGLWCAWNNGGISGDPGALSVRGPHGHPDWFGQDLSAEWKPGPFYGVSADMGDPEAKAWAINKTQQMVGDWKIDMLKTDVHPMINDCIRTDHRHQYTSDVSYWSTLGVYEVWDNLRKHFPGIVLENCSGASHIKDFGVLQRCAYTVTTDTLSNLPDRCGIYDSTFVLPPSALLTYTYQNGYNLPGDDPGPYISRSAMMTAWSVDPTNSAAWTPEMRASTIACVKEFKEWVRPIQKDCVVHHILPRPDGKHWDGMFFWSPKLAKGSLFVFRPDSDEERQTVKLAGLEPARRYSVWCDDGSLVPADFTGADLMNRGLNLRLANKYSSDLIHVQEARLPKPASYVVPRPVTSIAEANYKDDVPDYFGMFPETLRPKPRFTEDPNMTRFVWHPSPGARCYRLTVSTTIDMSHPVAERIIYEPQVELPEFPRGNLYARVDAIGWGGVAPGRSFKVQENVAPKPFDGKIDIQH